MMQLRSHFHLLKLEPSARSGSTEDLYFASSDRNFALGLISTVSSAAIDIGVNVFGLIDGTGAVLGLESILRVVSKYDVRFWDQ